MDKKGTNFLLLFFGTLIAVIGGVYLLSSKKKNKIHFDTDLEDGFETDAKNFQKDWQNISGDFQRAKEKCL